MPHWSECSECFVADKPCSLDLHKLAISGLVAQDFVSLDQLLQSLPHRKSVSLHPQERLVVIAKHGEFEAVHGDNLHYAASGGDADERMLLTRIPQRQTVRIRMLIAGINCFDANPDASVPQRLWRTGQSLVRCIPTQQTAKQPHVGTLAFMRRG